MRQRSARITLLMLMLLAVPLFAGCGGNARQKTLHTSYVAVTAACGGLEKFDDDRQAQIVEQATSKEEGHAKLDEHRRRLDKAYEMCFLAVSAIAAASMDKEEVTFTTAMAEAKKLFDEIQKLREAL